MSPADRTHRRRDRVREFPYTSEVVALALLLGVALFAGESLPLGITAIGIVSGFGVLLHAIGMILVYRTGRFLNFAQVQIGLVGAALFTALVQGELLLRAVDPLCGGCVGPDPSRAWEIANFLVAVVLGLVLAVLTSLVVYVLVVQRFAHQPRLVLTIATVFTALALVGLQSQLGWLLTTEDQREVERVNPFAASPLPWNVALPLEPAQLRLDGIVTIVVGVVAVLATTAYLRYSATGVAVRAAAENTNRARTLGINTTGVTARIWLLVGLLSGVAGPLTTFGSGSSGSAAAASGAGSGENVAVLPVRTLVLILAIAVVARFASFTMAALAALVFGVLQEATVWSWSSTAPLEVGFVVVIGVLLVLQRHRGGRADAESSGSGGWRANQEVRPIPQELRGIPVVRAWTRTGWFLAVVVGIGLPWLLSPSQTNVASIHLAYVIIGVSLLVLTGWAGQVSLGQFAFAAVGAFVVGVSGLPLLVALPVAGAAGAVVALLVGLPAMKVRGLNLAIMTLAFAVSATTLFVTGDYLGRFLPATMPRQSLLGIDLSDQRAFYYLTLVLTGLAVAAVLGLRRSRTGRVLIASRDNESTLQSYGVNLLRIRLAAFAFAGFLAAAAGAILASAYGAVSPAAFTPERSLTLFAFTVIGGLGGVVGPVIGMVYLAVLTLLNANPLVQAIGSGLVGLFVLAALPGGLAQGLYDARDAMLRRVGARHRIVVPSLYADRDPAAAFERAPLDERRGRRSVAVPGRFEPEGQGALQRYGDDSAATRVKEPSATRVKERIGG
jgi:branched-chain amino acid transport system permease protein